MAAAPEAARRRLANARPHPGGPALRHARPRRLLAMRLCHPERRLRGVARPGNRGLPRGPRSAQSGASPTRGRDRLLGRREAAHGARRPSQALVPAGAALHRRCGPRHVAGRRRRHQPRHSGCGRRRQYSVPSRCARELGDGGVAGQGAEAPRMADRDDASGAALRAEAHHQQCARHDRAPRPPFVLTLFNRFPFLRRLPARLIGMGFRPEHVHSPELLPVECPIRIGPGQARSSR